MSFVVFITISACLANPPEGKPDCRDYQLPRYELEVAPLPMQCMMQSQKDAAVWLEANPGWVIKKLKCSYTNDKNHIEGDI